MSKRTLLLVIIVLGSLFLYTAGFLLRWDVLGQQAKPMWDKGKPVPFALESGLQYRQVRTIVDGGTLPTVDPYIEVPRVGTNEVVWPETKALADDGMGITVAETYSLGSEQAYAPVARLLERIPGASDWPLERRVRWASVFFFCFAILGIAFWIGIGFRSIWGGAVGGLFYALCYASTVRSYGLDLSRENFALPWLAFFFAADAAGSRSRGVGKWIWHALAGVCIAISIGNWDLIQYVLGMWFAWWILRCAWRNPASAMTVKREDAVRLGLPLVGLIVAGFIDPYLSSHGFLFSPIMLLGLGAWLAVVVRAFVSGKIARFSPLLAAVPLVLFLLFGSQYATNYGHFGSLMSAKLAHLNIKPLNPAELTYTQRIMWTPALHSANWYALFDVFPYVLYLGLGGLAILAGRMVNEERRFLTWVSCGIAGVMLVLLDGRFGIPELLSPLSLLWVLGFLVLFILWLRWFVLSPSPDTERVGMLLFLTAITLFSFMFFFRFHVFTIFFLAGLLGASAAVGMRVLTRDGTGTAGTTGTSGTLGTWGIAWVAILMIGASMEGVYVLSDPSKTDRAGNFIKVRYKDGPPVLQRVNRQHDELLDLAREIKKIRSNYLHEVGRPPIILANFGLSASLLGLVEVPIVLHPKFETPEIRDRCEQFTTHLYRDDELGFRKWSEEFGTSFYIHQRYDVAAPVMMQADGTLVPFTGNLVNSSRYMVDALQVPDHAVAQHFEHGFAWPHQKDANGQPVTPKSAPPRYFQLKYQNSMYRIFRVVSYRDSEMALHLSRQARMHLQIGQYRRAMDKATQVIRHYDPYNEIARDVVNKLSSLLFTKQITREDLAERIKNVYAEMEAPIPESDSEPPEWERQENREQNPTPPQPQAPVNPDENSNAG